MTLIDWSEVWVPSLNVGEIILRGTVVYLFLFFMLRVLRRQAGNIGISDLLLIVLIADAAQNAMGNEYKSITEGLVLVSTIALWSYFLDYLGYKFPKVQRILHAAPLLLVKNGRFQMKHLEREMITRDELMEQLREQGVTKLEHVKRCWLEGNGHLSVVIENKIKSN